MSQGLDSSKSSKTRKVQDGASVSFIGAWLISSIQSLPTDTLDSSWQKNLILGVPCFSICIVEIAKWFWAFVSPESAEKIKLHRSLDKKQKQIEKDLKNPHFPETHKKKLQKELEAVSLDRINSYDRKV